MRNEHQTEDSLHAWLDNELSSRESALVGEHVDVCESCSATLAECRETRATVSWLLQSYDNTLASAPTVPKAERAKLSLSSRVPSGPIINHIVVNSRPMELWSAVKHLVPIAAVAMLFVGSATLFMMRSYHVVAGSVSAFANTSQKPFVRIDGHVFGVGGRPLKNVEVSISDTKARTLTDAKGYFLFTQVPRSANRILARSTGAYVSTSMRYTAGDGDDLGFNITLEPSVRTLNPVVVKTDADSVTVPPRPATTKAVPQK